MEDPRLFNAVMMSDSTVGHVLYDDNLSRGDDVHALDGHKWYSTDFSEFPCFHGYPMRGNWHEYDCRSGVVNLQDFASPVYTYVGNGQGDRAFTFVPGKYVIFQVHSLDLSGCSDNTRAHFARDKIF